MIKENLQGHLREIVRERDPYFAQQGHFYVREYIRQELGRWGKVESHNFEQVGKKYQNLILNLASRQGDLAENKPIILIGAHYDAVPGSPGADDNASGVAVLLELARLFAEMPARLPVQLVAFDVEEYGMVGSGVYAEELKEKGQEIRLMLSLEMLGYFDETPGSQRYPANLEKFYPNCGNYIALVGSLRTIPDMMRLKSEIKKAHVPCEWLPVPNAGKMVPDVRLSDHSPFWDLGYAAMMVTDTAYMRNPHYHQPSDTIETLNVDYMAGICEGLVQGLRVL